MKVTICGSIAFFDEMVEVKEQLERMGYEVKLPPTEVADEHGNMIPVKEYYNLKKQEQSANSWVWDRGTENIKNHFQKIEWSDVVLIINHEKKGIDGYIGGNTLMEMGLAFHLNKKIFLFNKIPDLSYKEEIVSMKPIVINGDLSIIM